MSKVLPKASQMTARMAEHAKRIRDTASWPSKVLPIKSQPWVTEANGHEMMFATIVRMSVESGQLYVIPADGSGFQDFASIEDLVKIWIGD